jgi:hypothetical protein
VVLEQVAHHQDAVGSARRLDHPLGHGDRLGERLLHEAVLARLEGLERHGRVGGHVGGHADRVEIGVVEQVVHARRHPCAGEARGRALAGGL